MSFSTGATGAAVDSCCSSYGSVSDSVHINSVSCQGNESSITSCRVSQNEGNYFYEVAVTCQQGGEKSVELIIKLRTHVFIEYIYSKIYIRFQ